MSTEFQLGKVKSSRDEVLWLHSNVNILHVTELYT